MYNTTTGQIQVTEQKIGIIFLKNKNDLFKLIL